MKNKFIKNSIIIFLAYAAIAVLFYFVCGDQLHWKDTDSDAVAGSSVTAELFNGAQVRQHFRPGGDELRSFSLSVVTFGRVNRSQLTLRIEDASGSVIAEKAVDCAGLTEQVPCVFVFDEPAAIDRDGDYYLTLSSDADIGSGVALWYGNSVNTARASVKKDIPADDMIQYNGDTLDGMLCFTASVRRCVWFGQYYWYFAAGAALLLIAYLAYLYRVWKSGKKSVALNAIFALQRYRFLIKQLVIRDFKIKYKRSTLGVFWSFLNPLLTMLVQYVIFSTLFKSDIPNFALYLLTGIVCFGFFSEVCNLSITTITGNSGLFTKVYIPKYIFPLTRVLSSSINLLISMIPLFAVALITGAPVTPALLLLPFGLLCLMAFCMGMGLVLSTSMVFFRDTQFLWGVLSMIWMYATPIFYPESIIPSAVMPLYKCNPLYHIVRFMRTVLISGVSPEPKAYVLCLVAAFVPLAIGALIFKANQDKFIYNL